MKKNGGNSNCLHYLFMRYDAAKLRHKMCLYIFNKYDFTMDDFLAKNGYGNDILIYCCLNKLYNSLKYLVTKYKFTENNFKRLEKISPSAKVKKILLINNLLDSKYNYNKMFDLIYKKN